jgi:hypothetical protein
MLRPLARARGIGRSVVGAPEHIVRVIAPFERPQADEVLRRVGTLGFGRVVEKVEKRAAGYVQ